MAVTPNKLFDTITNGAAWDAGVVFNRTNAIPIDKFSVFNTQEAAETYAKTNPVAYPGQFIAVVTADKVTPYVISVTGELQTINNDTDDVNKPVIEIDANGNCNMTYLEIVNGMCNSTISDKVLVARNMTDININLNAPVVQAYYQFTCLIVYNDHMAFEYIYHVGTQVWHILLACEEDGETLKIIYNDVDYDYKPALDAHIADKTAHLTAIQDDESGAYTIVDNDGNVIALFDANGLRTTTVNADEMLVGGINVLTENSITAIPDEKILALFEEE